MRINKAKEKIETAGGSWATFDEWMNGQSVGMYEDGETNFYDHDVNRFIRYNCDPKKEPFYEFD